MGARGRAQSGNRAGGSEISAKVWRQSRKLFSVLILVKVRGHWSGPVGSTW